MQDMSSIEPEVHRYLMETYLWLAVCMIAFAVGKTIGSLLAPLLAYIFSTGATVCLSYVLLPVYFYLIEKKTVISLREDQ